MFSVALLLLLLAAGSYVKCEQLTQPASVTVQPGQRLSITCQVSYSVSSYATAWIRQPAGKGLEWIGYNCAGCTAYYKDSLKNKFSISVDSSNKRVTLNGQNMQPEDSAVYYCARDWGGNVYFDYWGKGTTVTVTSASPTGPTVFPLMPCGSGTGNTVTLACLATGFTPSSVTFSWTKNGAALTDLIQYPPTLKGDKYTGISQVRVKRTEWDNRETFQCAVSHTAGSVTVPVQKPMVVYKEPTLKVCSSTEEGSDPSFSCFAKDFSPKEHNFKWLKNGAEMTSKRDEIKVVSEGRKDQNGTTLFSAASLLTVNSNELDDGATFTCEFRGKGEKGAELYRNVSVTFKEPTLGGGECPTGDVDINVNGPSTRDMFLNGTGTVMCEATLNRGKLINITWEDESGKNQLVGSPMKRKANTYVSQLDITYDEWSRGIKVYCVVEHSNWLEPVKKSYERNMRGAPQRPSVFMLPPLEHTSKHTGINGVTLTCYMKDFFPQEIFVSWLVDDLPVNSDYTFSTTNALENHGTYSAYSHLFLTSKQWEDKGVMYSCVVYHESVANSTKAIVRSTGYRTSANTNFVNLNMNVPDTCKA